MRTRVLLSILSLAVAAFPIAAKALPPQQGPKCRTTAGPASPQSLPVTVATFNVLHGLTEDPPGYPAHSTLDQRLALAAQDFVVDGIDVAGLQEVSLIVPNDPGVDPPTQHTATDVAAGFADALATRTGTRWHWCWFLANPHIPGEPDLQEGGGGPLSDQAAMLASGFVSPQYKSFKEGVAVVSRYPIVAAEGLHLPGRLPAEIPLCLVEDDPSGCALTAGFESRAALWTRIESPAGPMDLTTTHLAHDITALSDASTLVQAATVLAFSEAMSATAAPAHRFITCDCNSQPSDSVPVTGLIALSGWSNTFTADCAVEAAACTAGPDVIVTGAPSRPMNERLDYVFWKSGSCATVPGNGRIAVDVPQELPDGRWLWPSDHRGVAADVTRCS
ncbi:MAG: endonuclease/exonuclease/phosphatase family protein [Actinomycetota bacterium]